MNRRERKKEETRKSIISCALALFEEKGFNETLMEEIAEKADVAKGTLYNYFQDKESILVSYFQIIIADKSKLISTSLNEKNDIQSRLNKFLDFMNEIFRTDNELTTVYFKYRMKKFFESNPFDNPLRSGIETYIYEIIKDAQSNNELRNDIPPLLIARNFLLSTMNFFFLSLYGKEIIDIEITKGQLIEMFLKGAQA